MVADLLDPIDDSWEQAGMIAATIHNELQVLASGFGKRISDSDLHQSSQYQPPIRVAPHEQEPQSKDELDAVVDSARKASGI